MAPEPSKDAHKGGYSPHMKTVGWAILIMGLSLVLVIVAWMGIGTDPNYTAKVLQEQQASLRDQYGLPTQETSTAELEIPPSLRDMSGAGNATSAASNNTGGNQTAANATAGNQTGAGNGTAAAPASGGTKVSITQGAASKTTDAYDPNPVQAKVGSKVTWTNDDSTPHTATSGKDSKPDGTFDSSTLAQGKSFSFTFEEAGEYPYFCTLHPTMVGTVSLS
ncbi:MAG TPA: plastocyanin/azurin family copper-binding protein [Nitrososphaera sp.]|nr:plastocyanin/azurin family copper-binding protein [Nitrososphaera sp.]